MGNRDQFVRELILITPALCKAIQESSCQTNLYGLLICSFV